MITVQIPYTVETGEKLVNETFGPGNIRRRSRGTWEKRPMAVADGRAHAAELSFEKNGFVLVPAPTKVESFFDEQQLKSVYYPEAEQLIKDVSGASRVVIFDHTLRSGDEADLLLRGRVAIVQVWRAINRPIESNPLALADARTVATEDLLVSERRYPNRVGQTYRLKYNAAHRWFYFPRMRRDEAIVFKVYDSANDGRARFTPHTSFDDPTTPSGAPPRQSIEVRAFAFF